MADENILLNVAGLSAAVDEKVILHDVDLTVGAGETHVLMGPNGAGKSTLGHVVMGDPGIHGDRRQNHVRRPGYHKPVH